jgi:hypothetical protein
MLGRSAPSFAHSAHALYSFSDGVSPLSILLRSFRGALCGFPVILLQLMRCRGALTPNWLFLIVDEDYRGMTKVVDAGF